MKQTRPVPQSPQSTASDDALSRGPDPKQNHHVRRGSFASGVRGCATTPHERRGPSLLPYSPSSLQPETKDGKLNNKKKTAKNQTGTFVNYSCALFASPNNPGKTNGWLSAGTAIKLADHITFLLALQPTRYSYTGRSPPSRTPPSSGY